MSGLVYDSCRLIIILSIYIWLTLAKVCPHTHLITDEMSREMWEAVETKAGKTGMVKTKGGRGKRRSKEEERRKSRRTKEKKTEEGKDNGGKEDS